MNDKRSQCKLRKRYKNCLKCTIKSSTSIIAQYLASGRVKCRKMVATATIEFEKNRIAYAKLKRDCKYMKDVSSLPRATNKPFCVFKGRPH